MIAALAALSLLIAAPPPALTGRPVDRTEAVDALEAVRAGDSGPADALAGRPFRIAAPLAASDWSYEPGFGIFAFRPHPVFWSGSSTPALAEAIGLRIATRPDGEPLAIALSPTAFDWFMGGEGLTAVRIPMTPDAAAAAAGSLRLVIEGVFAPIDGRKPEVCGALGEGCILGARIDDLVLVYGPESAPRVLARWDPAVGE